MESFFKNTDGRRSTAENQNKDRNNNSPRFSLEVFLKVTGNQSVKGSVEIIKPIAA